MLKQEKYSPPTIMSSSPQKNRKHLNKFRLNKTLLYAKGSERNKMCVKWKTPTSQALAGKEKNWQGRMNPKKQGESDPITVTLQIPTRMKAILRKMMRTRMKTS
jgi:hypothetical protein